MTAEGRVEENVKLSAFTVAVIDYLQHVFEMLDAGRERDIISDPWFTRRDGLPPLTESAIDRLIAAIDEEFAVEIGSFAGYHRNRSGATATPDFHRLSPAARRAVAEGLDAIVSRYRDMPAEEAASC
jgi:hypothetical protein